MCLSVSTSSVHYSCWLCARVCIFLLTDQRGAQIDIHFSCTFSFYILRRSVRREEPEDMKEQESAGGDKRKSARRREKKTPLAVCPHIYFVLTKLLPLLPCALSVSGEEELSY